METVVNKASKPVSVNRYTYYTKGGVVYRIIANGINIPLAETVYTYRGELGITSQTTNGQGKPISSSKNEYDGDGNLVKQVIYNASGGVSRSISKVWKNGLEIETTQTSGDGKLQLRITNSYGKEGELLKRTIDNIQGNSKQVLEFEYEYRRSRGRT